VLHKKVKNALDKALEKADAPCILIRSLEKSTGKDPRVVLYHLKLLQAAGYGKVSEDKKLFCRDQ
jgi:hypothetical protein